MSQKYYVIRKLAYSYNDQYHSINTIGGIEGVFTSEIEAYTELTALEAEMFTTFYDLANIEQFRTGSIDAFQAERIALDAYLKQEFGISFLKKRDDSEYLYVDKHITLPPGISDDQIMKIREITGICFYDMYVFEEDIMFYAIWLPYMNVFYQAHGDDDNRSIYFYNTYDEALKRANRLYYSLLLPQQSISGTLEQLSDQPLLLESFLNATMGIDYLYNSQTIQITHHFDKENYGALNALLKQPLFEIREFPYEQAQYVAHEPFETM